jgi:hypothetical protein
LKFPGVQMVISLRFIALCLFNHLTQCAGRHPVLSTRDGAFPSCGCVGAAFCG